MVAAKMPRMIGTGFLKRAARMKDLRNYAELTMQRFKRIFGNTLKARTLPRQKTEAWIAAAALNRMTELGMPISVKIA